MLLIMDERDPITPLPAISYQAMVHELVARNSFNRVVMESSEMQYNKDGVATGKKEKKVEVTMNPMTTWSSSESTCEKFTDVIDAFAKATAEAKRLTNSKDAEGFGQDFDVQELLTRLPAEKSKERTARNTQF